jgi:threonine aldolase
MRHFLSDNSAAVHPEVMAALAAANLGHAAAYGEDAATGRVHELFRRHFGEAARTQLVFGGTGANVVGLASVIQPFEAVVCSANSHLWMDECGAPERFLGCKLIAVPPSDGKLTPTDVAPHLTCHTGVHGVRPRVLSITQATEWGTVYTAQETRALADLAHEHGLLLHVDGARLANAAAHLDTSLRALTTHVGVDLVSFGGAKNGMMFGEAVVLLTEGLGPDLDRCCKQAMQLASKMRFLAAQFEALLTGDLWLRNAAHANAMARRLASALQGRVDIAARVQTNVVFARIRPEDVAPLQARRSFYMWEPADTTVRWMTAWDTQPSDVDAFAEAILARYSTSV